MLDNDIATTFITNASRLHSISYLFFHQIRYWGDWAV